jgi:hypothetical protein
MWQNTSDEDTADLSLAESGDFLLEHSGAVGLASETYSRAHDISPEQCVNSNLTIWSPNFALKGASSSVSMNASDTVAIALQEAIEHNLVYPYLSIHPELCGNPVRIE